MPNETYSDLDAPEATFIEPGDLSAEIEAEKALRASRLTRKGIERVTETDPVEPGRRSFQVIVPSYQEPEESDIDREKFEAAVSKQYPHRVLAEKLAKGNEVLARILALHLRHTKSTTPEPTVRTVDGKQVTFYREYEHKIVFTEYGTDDEGNIYRYDENGWVVDRYYNDLEVYGDPEICTALGITEEERQEVLSRPVPNSVTITKISFEELPQL